jgi:hypothetical protein
MALDAQPLGGLDDLWQTWTQGDCPGYVRKALLVGLVELRRRLLERIYKRRAGGVDKERSTRGLDALRPVGAEEVQEQRLVDIALRERAVKIELKEQGTSRHQFKVLAQTVS